MTRFDKNSDKNDPEDPFAGVPDVDERLAEWVDGAMNDRDRGRFEAEMRVSPALRDRVKDYERTVHSIRSALQAETGEVDLADRVMARISQEETLDHVRKPSIWPYAWAAMSAAALLAIAVLVDLWGGSVKPVETGTVTAAHMPADEQPALFGDLSEEVDEGLAQASSGEAKDESVPPQSVDVSSRTLESNQNPKKAESLRVSPPPIGPATAGPTGLTKSSPPAAPDTIKSSARTGSENFYIGPVTGKQAKAKEKEVVQTESSDTALPEGSRAGAPTDRSSSKNSRGQLGALLAGKSGQGVVLPMVIIGGLAAEAGRESSESADSAPLKESVSLEEGGADLGDKMDKRVRLFFDQQTRSLEVGEKRLKSEAEEVDVVTDKSVPFVEFQFGSLQCRRIEIAADSSVPLAQKPSSAERSATTDRRRTATQSESSKLRTQPREDSSRDWLVVGPRSEVAKLLAAVRAYAAAQKGTCRSGEIRLVLEEWALSSDELGKPESAAVQSAKRAATKSPAAGGRGRLPNEGAESVERVVIRFRARR